MRPFVHRHREQRIVFGAGERTRIADELDALSAGRVLVVTGGSAAPAGRELADLAGERVVGIFEEVAQHVPQELATRAVDTARDLAATHLLSVGGGSATGLAKAVAVRADMPIVAVPTTYSGSEMTPIWAVTGDRKRTASDARALPATVLYDPELTLGLPSRVTSASGLNAMAQAVAAVAHEPPDPIALLYARAAIQGLTGALPDVTDAPGNLGARARVLYAACLAATALTATGTGLHHELAHILGGRLRLVHADVHTVLLPHTTARLPAVAPDGHARLCEIMATDDPAGALHDLARRTGAPTSLAELGVSGDVEDVVLDDLRSEALSESELHALVDDLHVGAPPVPP